ncbi:MAG: hypothetical protein LBR72_04365, partial [Oscillospiraceae bacterium]|nr:hypothetical protein [Oscillospiraceae bacterium]
MNRMVDLNGAWSLAVLPDAEFRRLGGAAGVLEDLRSERTETIQASVPGNFELDLVAAGKLADPFYGENVLALKEYDDCHLFYCRRVSYAAGTKEEPFLVFEGIDTYADIYLDGV